MVVPAFKKCLILNGLDGAKKNVIWASDSEKKPTFDGDDDGDDENGKIIPTKLASVAHHLFKVKVLFYSSVNVALKLW